MVNLKKKRPAWLDKNKWGNSPPGLWNSEKPHWMGLWASLKISRTYSKCIWVFLKETVVMHHPSLILLFTPAALVEWHWFPPRWEALNHVERLSMSPCHKFAEWCLPLPQKLHHPLPSEVFSRVAPQRPGSALASLVKRHLLQVLNG